MKILRKQVLLALIIIVALLGVSFHFITRCYAPVGVKYYLWRWERLDTRVNTVSLVNYQLRDGIAEKEANLFENLTRMGREAIPVLIKEMENDNARIRQKAIMVLCSIGGRDVVVPVIKALEDPNPQVRDIAVQGMGALDDKRVIPPLLEVMATGESEEIRHDAVNSLINLLGTYPLFGYDPKTNLQGRHYNHKAPLEKRQKAVKKFREWWEKNEDSIELKKPF